MSITIGSSDFKNAIFNVQNGNIKGTTSKIIDGHNTIFSLIQSVSQSSGSRLIHDSQHIQPYQFPRSLVRASSSLDRIWGMEPCITATAELVVPKSIPITNGWEDVGDLVVVGLVGFLFDLNGVAFIDDKEEAFLTPLRASGALLFRYCLVRSIVAVVSFLL
ncbi:hypothetical protein WICPIJ_010169 [Wickerhamomyces pijperi]|uniref:Uncharacterized protein n=1 Tax=Wickerhamomyces pijperi TaxID=599730 RepID=A0A9P8PIQ0_WICPI|nr:hypothetical protein WICPIJ_010169 [Wickerhamomyces pijperi]